ncbi:metallophosphoesterase family protein [Pedobacter deserti]|uniref:metallophosphoesterase family protein n=1 Tax=Pedobacter deserti TaxID=2817382 RepID=UPI00210E9E25|nr:metallophosphoesterase [Pedobacter sp. SYSU D00382]
MTISEDDPIHTTPVFKKGQPDDTYKYLPLPRPTGAYPYHLEISKVIPGIRRDKMTFQMVGDTGSMRNPDFLKLVSRQMLSQFDDVDEYGDKPEFLYHLGDIVYNHGEAHEYQRQFFDPFNGYPAPVFAIPGNHDSDVNPLSKVPYNSLDTFVRVFCSETPSEVEFSGGNSRKSMVQPNVYWTMETPLANFIGLASNVPKFGVVTPEQRSWFIKELEWAKSEHPDKALFVCIHHSPYSGDINHGSSMPMIEMLESAYVEAGVRPHAVFSGHVHNYQHFEKHYPDGDVVNYIVAGGGGYDELHPIARKDDPYFTAALPEFEGVRLVNYCDDRHGFLKVHLERTESGLLLSGGYFAVRAKNGTEAPKEPEDSFEIRIN